MFWFMSLYTAFHVQNWMKASEISWVTEWILLLPLCLQWYYCGFHNDDCATAIYREPQVTVWDSALMCIQGTIIICRTAFLLYLWKHVLDHFSFHKACPIHNNEKICVFTQWTSLCSAAVLVWPAQTTVHCKDSGCQAPAEVTVFLRQEAPASSGCQSTEECPLVPVKGPFVPSIICNGITL